MHDTSPPDPITWGPAESPYLRGCDRRRCGAGGGSRCGCGRLLLGVEAVEGGGCGHCSADGGARGGGTEYVERRGHLWRGLHAGVSWPPWMEQQRQQSARGSGGSS